MFLLILNGFFVAAEFAFTAARTHSLVGRGTRSSRAAIASMEELSFTLAGAQLGITIATLLLGYFAEPAVAGLIEAMVEPFFEIPADLLHTISFVIALLIVVFLHMVIGEMGPKNVAIADPERSALILALPFRFFAAIFRPIIWVLNEIANLGLRAVGVDPNVSHEAHTADDLASLITAGRQEGVVEAFAHRLLTGALDIWDLRVGQVMVPRTDVVALPISSTPRDVERVVSERGYSRIPVYRETLDEVAGFVHAKDLLQLDDDKFDQPIAPSLIRPLMGVPESVGVADVLEEMRRDRNHLAMVIDEYGGMAGIVSLEDIVEEVVGEIRDEHDEDVEGIRRISPRRYLVEASLRPSEVRRALDVDLPEGDYETVGGLVMAELGRIPEVGDRIVEEAWTIRVRAMDGHRVGDVDILLVDES